MTLHAVWIDNGQNPDYGKLQRAGIDLPYFDPRDPRVSASYLDTVRSQPRIAGCGLYFAWNWYPTLDGKGFAEKCDAELRRVAWHGNPAVCADIETHDVGYILAWATRWRELRPTRPTWLTLEGFQGGLFPAAAVELLNRANIRLAPQFYDGAMGALGHSVIIDLLMAGFAGERIDGMYDAARLPWRWRGFAFTQGRLP